MRRREFITLLGGANEKCGCALGDHRLESRVYLSRRASLQDGELPRGGTLRLTQLFHLCIEIRIVGVEQRGGSSHVSAFRETNCSCGRGDGRNQKNPGNRGKGNGVNRLKRQQQERKEKYRKRQCRANHEQHHQLSKLCATHDVQRQTQRREISRWGLPHCPEPHATKRCDLDYVAN
jgi:hypothetical protein